MESFCMKKTTQNKGWRYFLKLCLNAGNEKKLEELLDLLLTLEEKSDLNNRCLIIKTLLENKMTQREIAETFHVSISKITRGSNALKIISPQTRSELTNFFSSDGEK